MSCPHCKTEKAELRRRIVELKERIQELERRLAQKVFILSSGKDKDAPGF